MIQGIVLRDYLQCLTHMLYRESPAIHVVGQLLIEGAQVHVYDPLVKSEQARSDLLEYGYGQANGNNLSFHSDPYNACIDSSAIVVCTEWDEFRTLNYREINAMMQKPAHVFDGRLVLDTIELKSLGFEVYCIGKGDF